MPNQPFAARWRWLRALAALVIALTSLLQIAPAMAAATVIAQWNFESPKPRRCHKLQPTPTPSLQR